MDVMTPLAALHIIRHPMAVQRLLTPQRKAGAQFTDPEGMEEWFILDSAIVRAVGVRGECVTTRPPAV